MARKKDYKEDGSERGSAREQIRLAEFKKFAAKYSLENKKLNAEQQREWQKHWRQQTETVAFNIKLQQLEAKKLAKTFKEEIASAYLEITNKFFDSTSSTGSKNISTTMNLGKQIGRSFSLGLENYLGAYSNYFSSIQTRLLGTGKDFDSVMRTIKAGTGGTQATSSLKVLENLNKLVSEGISYNVEQRAFLETISDKIAITFDATNGTLTRLIRINQSDMTAAYLGMESALTQFLNSAFGDSSYMAKGISKSVSDSLLEATSQLGKGMGAEFEFVVQKWLGSLASVGVGTGSVGRIAQGIGYLGSGNIEALGADQGLTNLLVSAAKNKGLDYGSMLSGEDLTPSNINLLMEGIVSQLQTIGASNNAVVRSQYAQLFGMTISDLTSVLNISSEDLRSISSNMYQYATMVNQTELELQKAISRTSVKERVENAVGNAMTAMGETITSSAGLYVTYLITDMINNAGGLWVPTPFVGPINVTQIMESLIFAGTALANVSTIFSALTGTGKLSLEGWGAENTISRGEGMTMPTVGTQVAKSTSAISYVGGSDQSDILGGSLADSKETQNITGSITEDKDVYEAIAGMSGTNYYLAEILDVLD